MLKLGNNNIGKVFLGSNEIGKAYLGSNLVFQKGPAGFAVTYALTNVTSSNTSTVASGSYTTTLTPAAYHTLGTVTVTMGGLDVTASVYANGVVSIASVTGAIVITATATHQYPGWIRMRTKMGQSTGTAGWIVRTATIMTNNVSKMVVDGVEVTKNFKYDFGDSNYHTVFLLLDSSTDLPGSCFYLQSGVLAYLWIPDTYKVIGASALRAMGSASLLWNNPSTPTSIGSNAFMNSTSTSYFYVPDASLNAYKSLSGWPAGRTYAMSDYEGTIY